MSEKVNYNLYVMILDQEQYERIKKLMREHANWDDEAEREIEKDLQNADLVDFEGKVKCAFHLNLLLADQISREEFVQNGYWSICLISLMKDLHCISTNSKKSRSKRYGFTFRK